MAALTRIRLPPLPIDAAAAALATFLYRLQEYGLPTPKLDVRFGEDGAVQVSVLSGDAMQVQLAFQCWGEQLKRGSTPPPSP